MMVGIVVSNSILIVEFTHRLEQDGIAAARRGGDSCRIRLRPILMTSLATIFGLIPIGAQAGNRQRRLCAAGARHHRRPRRIGRGHGLRGALPRPCWSIADGSINGEVRS